MIDYYAFLGVERDSTTYEIRKAYRKMAMKLHPDRGGAVKDFQQLQEVYTTLSDPDKRFVYDNPTINTEDIDADIIDDWYENRHEIIQNKDVEIEIELSLNDVLNGKEVVATIGLFSGKTQMVDLHIPRNIQNGGVIRFEQLGDDSIPALPRGDLLVTIVYENDEMFERNGFNVIFEQSISAFDAMIGGVVTITSFDDKTLDFEIPAGIQYGDVVKRKGCGLFLTPSGKRRGDLIMKVYVTIPEIRKGSDVCILQAMRDKYENS